MLLEENVESVYKLDIEVFFYEVNSMEFNQLVFVASFVFCFLGTFTALSFINNGALKNSAHSSKITYTAFYLVNLIAFSALIFIKPQTFDFITNPTSLSLILPIIAAGLLFVISPWLKKATLKFALIIALGCAIIWLTPNNVANFNDAFPLWLNQILSLFLLVAITRTFRYLNGIDGLITIETITIGLGLFFLSLVGGLPNLLGNLGLCLASSSLAMLVFSWYPCRLKLGENECDSLGFIIAWLALASSFEGSGSCFYIFATFFTVELVWAMLKKLTFLPAYQDIYANTTYYDKHLNGLLPSNVCKYVIRANFVLLMFGCFQVFAPNPYSLPLLSTIIIIWNISKLRTGDHQTPTLKEINQQFYGDLKQEFHNIKKQLNKDE